MNNSSCVNNCRYKYKYKENTKNMADCLKRILSPVTGCKKQKSWNKTREKYMPVKRSQNLAVTDWGSFYRDERLEEFLDSKGAFYNSNESDNDDETYNENNKQQQLPEGFVNSCYKIVSPILLQKLINDFAVCKHQKHLSGTLLHAGDVKNHIF